MSETTAPVAKAAAKAATEATNKVLPTVIDHTELALDIPSKVVLKQPLIVVASVAAGIALTSGSFYVWQKLKDRKAKKAALEIEENVPTIAVKEMSPKTPSGK